MLEFLLFDNSILSKPLIQHPIITLCMFCSFHYWSFWNPCSSLYICVCWPIKAVNSSVRSFNIHTMPRLRNMHKQKLLTLSWCSFSWWVNEDILHCAACQAANTPYMNYCQEVTLGLQKLQDKSLLTLHWGLLSGWCKECVATVFALKSGQYLIYECLQPVAT